MNDTSNIRLATQNDLPTIVAIYNQAIESKKATADTSTYTVEEREGWFNKFDSDLYPIYVAEIDSQVVGYATLSPYRKGREALKKVAEISFYVANKSLGQGIGSALVNYAINDCKRINKETLLAILLDVNTPSIHLLKKFNFKEWGHLPLKSDFDGISYGQYIYGINL